MLTIQHGAFAAAPQGAVPGMPRITPVHAQLDRRHSDLSFNIDTAGRPFFRVLLAREPSLFAPAQAGARNASNFYDSQREGLLHFDGLPCFYLVPRSVLHALQPASRLYYTLIAYDDAGATRAAYAHAPESLSREAPAVSIAADLAGSLGLMFGTPVSSLMRVGDSLGWQQSVQEEAEDSGDAELPASLGLSDEGAADADDDGAQLSEAAAWDAEGEPPDDDSAYAAATAYAESGEDEGHDGDDPYAGAASLGLDDDEGLRPPVYESAQAAALGEDDGADDGYESYGAAAAADWDDAPPGEDGDATAAGAQSLADDYDDGFGSLDGDGGAPAAGSAYGALGEDDAGDGHYGAEHEESDGGGAAYGLAMRAPLREDVPDMLPDEDADGAHAAPSGAGDEDEVDIDAPAAGQGYGDEADEYGEAGAAAHMAAAPQDEGPVNPFDIQACKALLARLMPLESGSEGFSRVVEDGEFAGRFGSAHPAYQRFHLGLTFGAFPFVQEAGTLGQLLVLMRERDRATFDGLFPEADRLIAVTNSAEGPRAWESPDGYSARLQPVAGQRLWQEPWVGRFRRAGQHLPFQGAQNELAARLYVQPVLPVARQLGLNSEQALTLLVDRAVQMGPQAALAWVLEAATPVETPALRQQALAALGHADLRAFQIAQQLPATGVWDVATHAALIAALRAHPRPPVPVLSRGEIVAAMLRHAQGTPWAERMRRLHDAVPARRLFQF